MKNRKRRREALAESEEQYKRIFSEIVHQPHWIMFSAEFLDTDRAIAAMKELSFFNQGNLPPAIRGGVVPFNGATVLLGGELTSDQVDEIAFAFTTQAQEFTIAFHKQDKIAEERSAPARSLLKYGVAAKMVSKDRE
jgi:hypothetical protein